MNRSLILFVVSLIVANLVTSSVMANTTMVTSWYGPGLQGNLMANGEEFDMNDPTVVAHKTLPFGTKLKLTNPDNGHSLIVVVQDRGPFIPGRHLDVSKAAAKRLGFIKTGVTELVVEVVD